MRKFRNLLIGVLGSLALGAVGAQAAAPSPAVRDGQHDFDFNLGTWHTHIHSIADPFDGKAQAVEMDGTVTVRKVWGGRAWLEEIEADGPDGHWQGATLFLYNPQSGQWSQDFVDSGSGKLNTPTIGSFHDGVGELYATDTFNGRQVLVRGVWSNIKPDSHTYAESYSDDGGKTWHATFIGDLTRVK